MAFAPASQTPFRSNDLFYLPSGLTLEERIELDATERVRSKLLEGRNDEMVNAYAQKIIRTVLHLARDCESDCPSSTSALFQYALFQQHSYEMIEGQLKSIFSIKLFCHMANAIRACLVDVKVTPVNYAKALAVPHGALLSILWNQRLALFSWNPEIEEYRRFFLANPSEWTVARSNDWRIMLDISLGIQCLADALGDVSARLDSSRDNFMS